MLTVYFEDHGQDFLEWDIKDGIVVACRPFQGWLWNGTKVHSTISSDINTDIRPGLLLDITTRQGKRTRLRYPIERIEEKVSV